MDEASTPTTGYVKVLFPLHPRAIVIQRNSMDPVVADVDNDGLLLPPPNRRISFVSARPPTPTVHRKFRKFRLAQFWTGFNHTCRPWNRHQPISKIEIPPLLFIRESRFFEMDSIVDSFSGGSMRSTRKNLNEIAIDRCGSILWIICI